MNSLSNIRIKFDIPVDKPLAEFIQKQFTFFISLDEIPNLYGVTTNSTGKFYRGSHSLESFNYWNTLPILSLTEYINISKGQTNESIIHSIITKLNNYS